MKKLVTLFLKSTAVCLGTVVLFSCSNSSNSARDFLADKNLPVGTAKNIYHTYKDSGFITSKLITNRMLDFSNRKAHPYSEFPDGIKIINFENNGLDSVTITGDYAITYSKTSVSEIRGHVVVKNHSDFSKLVTEQLFWDQKTSYFVSEKPFTLTKENDTIFGVGFESKDNLSKHLAKKITGKLETSEN
ncbi:MAG: LPS export ABC transporter periplasmic protein LptC [Polaribacter sp.]|jgi:LPS export ABC transporter protein LptC